MKMKSGGAWAVVTAFIVLGLLTQFDPLGAGSAGLNWVVAGIVAFLVTWFMAK
ncbi:MAG: hypothetical protein V1944_02335 [Candidatus Aenigmatarchaeota archaeon]